MGYCSKWYQPPVKHLPSGLQVFGLSIDCFMLHSLTTCINSAQACHLLTVYGSSSAFNYMVWNGSINPFHDDVHLVRCTLHKLPSILQPLSRWGVSGYRCQSFYFIPRTQDTVHPCVLESQKPCCHGLPLLLLKLHTQVDQLCLSIQLICHELHHLGGSLEDVP